MRYRIQAEDGRHVEWQQDGPLVIQPGQYTGADLPVAGPELWLTDAEATELCFELAFQIMRLRHPERE